MKYIFYGIIYTIIQTFHFMWNLEMWNESFNDYIKDCEHDDYEHYY
jgi:hypothetical protein